MTEQNARPRPKGREAYRHFTAFATRWRDNDQYGHMNNAVYYELFDSAVNKFLIDSGILALAGDKTQFLVASSGVVAGSQGDPIHHWNRWGPSGPCSRGPF